MRLVRTNDDVVVMATIAVIYDRVLCKRYTKPFTLPLAAELATITVFEPRVNSVAQPHVIAFVEEVLADKRRVGLGQGRNDIQRQVNRTVATTGRRVLMAVVIVHVVRCRTPDRLRILSS